LSIEEKLRKEYEKRRETNRYEVLIWLAGILLSGFLIIFGIVEFILDHEQCSFVDLERISPNNPNSQLACHGLDHRGEEIVIFPVFGLAFRQRTNTEGILPNIMNITINDFIALGLIVLIAIPSFFIYSREARRLKLIDENLPYLLREIADSQRIGMHLPRAIAEASKRNYGPLTPELKKLAAKVTWGISFREAMLSFRNAVDTSLARQATILILEAEKSGGELEQIFDSATNHIQEQLDIKKDREASIKPYVTIIYVSYIIFCLVVSVLFSTFFVQFSEDPIVIQGQGEVVVIPIHAFKVAFIYAILSQGFFSGLTAGKMGAGSIKNGFIHSSVLMIIGFLFFKFVIA
jgi:archaeal flagellar protein FlaJ